jgi:hypothetical protein
MAFGKARVNYGLQKRSCGKVAMGKVEVRLVEHV